MAHMPANTTTTIVPLRPNNTAEHFLCALAHWATTYLAMDEFLIFSPPTFVVVTHEFHARRADQIRARINARLEEARKRTTFWSLTR